ncbi:MAG: hypothetical protein ACFNTU_00280 [Catonella sp.]
MVNMTRVEWAREKAKKNFELLFEDKCNIYEYVKEKQPNGSTAHKEKLVFADIPCRISFKTVNQVAESIKSSTPMQSIKLFIPNDINIKDGSKIVITRQGETTAYKNSGVLSKYATHGELGLELFKEWS